jgi:hypothetical protein
MSTCARSSPGGSVPSRSSSSCRAPAESPALHQSLLILVRGEPAGQLLQLDRHLRGAAGAGRGRGVVKFGCGRLIRAAGRQRQVARPLDRITGQAGQLQMQLAALGIRQRCVQRGPEERVTELHPPVRPDHRDPGPLGRGERVAI